MQLTAGAETADADHGNSVSAALAEFRDSERY